MSDPARKYIDLALQGHVDLDDIDDFVDEWHDSKTSIDLASFLGLTQEEYSAWVEEPAILAYIVTARRDKRDFRDLVSHSFDEYRLAARSESEEKIAALRTWLEAHGKLK